MLSNEQLFRQGIKGLTEKKMLETNEGSSTAYQNLGDIIKAVLRGNFISINAYVKKMETMILPTFL